MTGNFRRDDVNPTPMDDADAAKIAHAAFVAAHCSSRPKKFLAWAVSMFGPIALDRCERLSRFVEEAIELAHAEGMAEELIGKIVARVYSREAGITAKELGQAQATLETFAENIGLSADVEAAREFERVLAIPREEWERRHEAKVALGIALAAQRAKEGEG